MRQSFGTGSPAARCVCFSIRAIASFASGVFLGISWTQPVLAFQTSGVGGVFTGLIKYLGSRLWAPGVGIDLGRLCSASVTAGLKERLKS